MSATALPHAENKQNGAAAQASAPVVQVANLRFAHPGAEAALENVSLTMEEGEFLAVIGPNGGGKTTLLRLLLGLLQPDQGSVRIFGKAPSSVSRNIGYVPQFSTLRADFPASVLEAVLMGGASPSLFGGGWPSNGAAKKRAFAYLDALGLADCAGSPIGALSGGQRQRALVARALMSRPLQEDGKPAPFLLLLDEPTASIDPHGKFCFYEFLGNLRGSITMVVVSHDLFMVSPFFSSIAFVNKSLTRFEGGRLSPENLTLLFGQHLHDCPVADMQHSSGLLHDSGCSHPACSPVSTSPERAACPAPVPSHAECAFCKAGMCTYEGHGKRPPAGEELAFRLKNETDCRSDRPASDGQEGSDA